MSEFHVLIISGTVLPGHSHLPPSAPPSNFVNKVLVEEEGPLTLGRLSWLGLVSDQMGGDRT